MKSPGVAGVVLVQDGSHLGKKQALSLQLIYQLGDPFQAVG